VGSQDFVPITIVAVAPNILIVPPSLPVKSVRELPTIAEAGVPGYEASTWYGVMAPAGTAAEITARLYTAIIADLRVEDTRARIAADGGKVVGSSPEEFAAVLKRDFRNGRMSSRIPARAQIDQVGRGVTPP
jgi:tripartite-type tricarboxylate transporter receptor subunit TctC